MNPMDYVSDFACLCNLIALFFNVRNTRLSKKMYQDATDELTEQINNYHADFKFHTDRLIEEIELLKTNEGLYDLRDNPEQYETYLTLLRKK